jgi:uncharacterized protein involved in outer membrane biogenesis
MQRIVCRLALGLIALAVLSLVLGWIFFSVPLFAQVRIQIASNLLSDAAGYPLVVKEDARITLGPTTEVVIKGVELTGTEDPDDALAKLGSLKFDLNFLTLMRGQFQPDEIVLDGLQVKLLTQADGKTNWSVRPDNQDIETAALDPTDDVGEAPNVSSVGILLLRYFINKNASFGSVGLVIDNQVSGFSFVFNLNHLNFIQDISGGLGIAGRGTVNEQSFDIAADIPDAGPFFTQLNFGAVNVAVDGEIAPQAQPGEFAGRFSLSTGEIGDMLEVLQLKPVITGSADLIADIAFESDVLHVEKLDVNIAWSDGKQAKIEGSISDFFAAEGINLSVTSRFHPLASPPKSASTFKDLALTGISAKIVGDISDLEFEEVRLRTNAFDAGLNELGPVAIGGIKRTPDGYLTFQDVSIQAGQMDGAFLDAQGRIGNVLQLKDYGFEGQFTVPAPFVLKRLRPRDAQSFGSLEVGFSIDDSKGPITLRQMAARSVNTSLWKLNASATIADISTLQGAAAEVALDIESGARFLEALNLRKIDTGPFHFSGAVRHNDSHSQIDIGLGAGNSRVNANLKVTDTDGIAYARGRVFSEELELTDLSKAIMAATEIQVLLKPREDEQATKDGPDAYQPLVVEETYQPLVLEKSYEPLVLPPQNKELSDFITLRSLLLGTDLDVDIDIKKLTGQQGISRITSELIIDKGKARLGPLEVKYGGGFIQLDTRMDLLSTPDLLSVSGATRGWDFGKILASVGLDIKANGILNANFDVTGNWHSSRAFVNSMYGTASIKVKDGKIATSLLELAGLGIFPWLFSKELASGYTDIVCVSAPLRIENGKVTMNPLVAETRKVQVVSAGNVDFRKRTIGLIAEPRPVGRPWARTAWPFSISGSLSKPEFKIRPDVKIQQTNDMAGKMKPDREPCRPDARQLE